MLFRVCCAAGAVGLFTSASWVGVVLTAFLLELSTTKWAVARPRSRPSA